MWLYAAKVSESPKRPNEMQESRMVNTKRNFLNFSAPPPILKAFLRGSFDLISLNAEPSFSVCYRYRCQQIGVTVYE